MIVQSGAAQAIGRWVRSERERQGLRQDEVALAAGVSPRTVFQVEQGKPTSRLDVVSRILDALGLSLQVAPAPRVLAQPGASPGAARGPRSRFHIFRDASGSHRWRLFGPNNELLASSEAYASRSAALEAARAAAAAAQNADIAQDT